MNSIDIQLDIGEAQFVLTYDIPDVVGEIRPTDLNVRWLDEHVQAALRPVFGKLLLAEGFKVAPKVKRATAESVI